MCSPDEGCAASGSCNVAVASAYDAGLAGVSVADDVTGVVCGATGGCEDGPVEVSAYCGAAEDAGGASGPVGACGDYGTAESAGGELEEGSEGAGEALAEVYVIECVCVGEEACEEGRNSAYAYGSSSKCSGIAGYGA